MLPACSSSFASLVNTEYPPLLLTSRNVYTNLMLYLPLIVNTVSSQYAFSADCKNGSDQITEASKHVQVLLGFGMVSGLPARTVRGEAESTARNIKLLKEITKAQEQLNIIRMIKRKECKQTRWMFIH